MTAVLERESIQTNVYCAMPIAAQKAYRFTHVRS